MVTSKCLVREQQMGICCSSDQQHHPWWIHFSMLMHWRQWEILKTATTRQHIHNIYVGKNSINTLKDFITHKPPSNSI